MIFVRYFLWKYSVNTALYSFLFFYFNSKWLRIVNDKKNVHVTTVYPNKCPSPSFPGYIYVDRDNEGEGVRENYQNYIRTVAYTAAVASPATTCWFEHILSPLSMKRHPRPYWSQINKNNKKTLFIKTQLLGQPFGWWVLLIDILKGKSSWKRENWTHSIRG